jgi:hypothetical protein
MFQIVRLTLDDDGEVIARRPLQPFFELWDDAMAMLDAGPGAAATDTPATVRRTAVYRKK